MDDSVEASSPVPPEVADNPGPLEVESSLGQLDDDPEEEEPARADPTAAEIVQAGVAQGQLDVTTVPIDQRDLDVTEEQLIQEFIRDGCKCDLGPSHTPCSSSITVDHLRAVRCQMADLTHDELDLVVIGQVMAGCFSSQTFRKQERSRSFTIFHHNGARICQKTFLFLHTMLSVLKAWVSLYLSVFNTEYNATYLSTRTCYGHQLCIITKPYFYSFQKINYVNLKI